ncbi:iodotyrosine deiodinase [Sitodiplosis mosellana]|uniref:iodotyrosine deiodinase n=1 Tax=Sitodiplosis mosellana TaxID=263140 RepID=UPI0024448FC0|nr:iodotyrosine deiodinase [Sitodiplosis mosellana]
MFTFTELRLLCAESIFLKYSGYFLPLLLFILTKYVWKRFACSSANAARIQKEVIDTSNNIQTDATNDEIIEDEYRPHLPELEHVAYRGLIEWLDKSGDKFFKLANDRRSIRKFAKNKHVDIEVIEKCILAAGTSPSGAHTEPWTFCVIQDALIKQEIREIIEAEEYLNYSQRMSRQWTTDLRPLKTDFIKEYLTDAPYLIIVFKQVYGIRSDGMKQQHYYNEISVSIATGILLCALQSAGLNSLVTTPLNCGPAIRNLLNRPQNEKLLVLLPVGYAADDCCVPDLQRKSLNDIMVTY